MYEREHGYIGEEIDFYKERPMDLKPLKHLSGWKMAKDAEDIRGMTLVDQDHNDIGKVDDLLMSTDLGEAVFAIVSMERMHHLIPLDKLSYDKENKRVVFHGTKDLMHNSPEYKEDVTDYGQYYDYWSGVRSTAGYGAEHKSREFRHYVVYPGETDITTEEEEEEEQTRRTNY